MGIIQTGVKGLSICVGEDGVWLNLDAPNGNGASFNLEHYAKKQGPITERVILDWCRGVSTTGTAVPKLGMPGYESLERVLADAVAQASSGKGKARHAVEGEPFEKQQICEIARRLKGHPAASVLFQVVKKVYESGRLDKDAAIAELRGAVNYLGAALIVMEEL